MLVLSRKPTEAILIGDEIEIRVLRIAGGRVRIGVVAPSDVRVRRAELEEAVPVGAGRDHEYFQDLPFIVFETECKE